MLEQLLRARRLFHTYTAVCEFVVKVTQLKIRAVDLRKYLFVFRLRRVKVALFNVGFFVDAVYPVVYPAFRGGNAVNFRYVSIKFVEFQFFGKFVELSRLFRLFFQRFQAVFDLRKNIDVSDDIFARAL